MELDELPAGLPAPIKEQLQALAQYLVNVELLSPGRFALSYSLPRDIVTQFDTDFLTKHGIDYDLQFEESQPAFGGRIMREMPARLTLRL